MKKTISFEKKIEFPSMIGEITSISLEHTLKLVDSCNIEGNFIVSGTYKLTEASRIEESFNYELPSEIILGEKIDIKTAKIEIEDFYYEIENDYTLICYIDIKVEGVEEIDFVDEEQQEDTNYKELLEEQPLKIEKIELPKEEELTRECDGDVKEKEFDEEKNERDDNMITEDMPVSSLFENINESEETYATYTDYILREEETVTSLIGKYKTTKEELESYNDLSNLTVGSKIIIPLHEEK